jgi:hypothetical protein
VGDQRAAVRGFGAKRRSPLMTDVGSGVSYVKVDSALTTQQLMSGLARNERGPASRRIWEAWQHR